MLYKKVNLFFLHKFRFLFHSRGQQTLKRFCSFPRIIKIESSNYLLIAVSFRKISFLLSKVLNPPRRDFRVCFWNMTKFHFNFERKTRVIFGNSAKSMALFIFRDRAKMTNGRRNKMNRRELENCQNTRKSFTLDTLLRSEWKDVHELNNDEHFSD